KTSHNAVISICERISDDARIVMEGGTASVSDLENMCSRLNSDIYGRLHDRLFATARDATVIDLTSSLMSLGRAVIERERDPKVLEAVIGLMDSVKGHENGEVSLEDVCSSISSFIDDNGDADLAILASARTVSSKLRQLSEETGNVRPVFSVPSKGRVLSILKENMRRDSVTFTFAVRMSLMYALWAFVWQYWDLENAKWLLFTTAALVQPYIEGTWTKSCMRVAGTLLGAAGFAVIAILTGQDAMLMSVVLMVISYIYTLIDPKRYDVMMTFITMTALLAVAASDPRGDVLMERLVFVLAGVVAALFANMTILPYRLKDENIELGRRSMKVSIAQIGSLRRAACGEAPSTNDPYLTLKSAAISQKMQMNDKRDPDTPFSGFISIQNAISSECSMLQGSVADSGEECRCRVVRILDGRKDTLTEEDLDGLDDGEREILKRTANLLRMHRENRVRLGEAALALPE
ncbi:MAG: FUSC family protein, partial [Candidatus Methanomethylophilaceae archaeon]